MRLKTIEGMMEFAKYQLATTTQCNYFRKEKWMLKPVVESLIRNRIV